MGYVKSIRSGRILEVYKYNKDIDYDRIRNSLRKRNIKAQYAVQNMGANRDPSIQPSSSEKFAKRQDNINRSRISFRRLVSSNLGIGEDPIFVSFTFNRSETDVSKCSRFFHLLTVRMRRHFGKSFRYIAVPEFQKDFDFKGNRKINGGSVHYHALFWGLPRDILYRESKARRKTQDKDRVLAHLWGQGFVDVVFTDGSDKLAGYMTKYMTKAIKDKRLVNHKAYFASRNVYRPIVNKGVLEWWVSDDYDLENIVPEFQQTFDTKWLGECVYSRYKILD